MYLWLRMLEYFRMLRIYLIYNSYMSLHPQALDNYIYNEITYSEKLRENPRNKLDDCFGKHL